MTKKMRRWIMNQEGRVTATGIPFRTNTGGTSKFTISKDIYDYLVTAFMDEKEARQWLMHHARENHEKGKRGLSNIMREIALQSLIQDELIEGYEVEPEYVVVRCSFKKGDKNTVTSINIPAAMAYALEKRGDVVKDIVKERHKVFVELRDIDESLVDFNISESIRRELLAELVNDELIDQL